MNRTRLLVTALLIFLFASCAPTAAPAPTSIPSPKPSPAPTATSVPHASEIRFALIGNVTPVNVWALFDAKGYSYNNYAVMSGYWSRLYQLSIPDRSFETMAASGMPSLFVQEGNLYAATVPLRSDLKWTDGTPFTADDVAFTVNTAVSFQLGFDWHDFYNPDFIDHAEAVDAHTVKFYFKKQPNVGVWQYGALQGPIVQKAYWESKVSASAALLPPNTLLPQIASLTAQAADMQSKIDTVNANIAILSTTSTGYIQGVADIKGLQANLNQTNTALSKAQSQYDSAMDAARQSLYALDNANEPTLGDWTPVGKENGAWINKVNPLHPFNAPNFDRAVYKVFQDYNSADDAFSQNEVDVILNSYGYLPHPRENPYPPLYSTNDVSFLVFNPRWETLSDPALRRAIACIKSGLDYIYTDDFSNFVLAGPWQSKQTVSRCGLSGAVEILQAAGYSWTQKPTSQQAGQGLTLPSGKPFPLITLIVPKPEYDLVRTNDGEYEIKQMQSLGIPITLEMVDPETLHYDVFSSDDYDIAILSWTISEYPGYLCQWFQSPESICL